MPDVDALLKSLFENLPEEAQRDLALWIARARESTAAEVERDLLATAREARDEFRNAAALVERMIAE